MTTLPTLSNFTAAPDLADMLTLKMRITTTLSEIITFVPQMNDLITKQNSNTNELNNSFASASASATTATNQAIIATAKANEIQSYVVPTSATYSPDEIDAKDAVYRSERYAISGSINKKYRGGTDYNGAFAFRDGYGAPSVIADSVSVMSYDKYYFKSLDKIVSPGVTTVKFPQAPTATNLIVGTPSGTSFSETVAVTNGSKYVLEYIDNGSYHVSEVTATSGTYSVSITGTSITHVAMFKITDLLRYDNLLLRDDGTYIITRTEQNQYITMDTMLNYTSTVYNVADGSSTGTSVTFTYDMVNEEYSGSDGHKYLTIGATARFNQGAYHPVFNAYGTSYSNNTVNANGSAWHNSTYALPPRNIAESFLKRTSRAEYGACELLSGGALVTNESGRPDGKFYDIIYNELWIDQRWRAEYVDGTKERTTIERDKDISASQYADFVGSATFETVYQTSAPDYGTPSLGGMGVATEWYDDLLSKYSISNTIKIFNLTTGLMVTNAYIDSYALTYRRVFLPGSNVGDKFLMWTRSRIRYGSNTFLHTDIIGNPANYPTVWKDALAGGGSIAGTPLLVGENRESLIPNGSSLTFKATKKVNNVNLVVYTPDSGASFGVDTVNWETALESPANALTVAQGGNMVFLLQYQAYNNNLSPIVNSKVVGSSAGVGDVYANNASGATYGNKLLNNFTQKVATNDVGINAIEGVKTSKYLMLSSGLLYSNASFLPVHETISLYGSVSPAVKLFSYLTNATTRHKQAYVFKEMKYDATGVNQDGTPTDTWGEDNKFGVVDNVSTTTDNNGNTILIGQKARLIDYRVRG